MNNKEKNASTKISMLISFALTFIAVILVFNLLNIMGATNYSILKGDLYQQYIVFIHDFINSIKNGESIWFSFSNYLGLGNILNVAYYCLSPFNILYMLDINELENITIVLIGLKLALAALSMNFFLNKTVKESYYNIGFALFYGLSGYVSAFYFNIMWLDAIYMLPVIIYLVMRFVKTEKYLLLVLAYSYLFLTNFYTAYMVGIFSAVVFVTYLLFVNDFSLKDIKAYVIKAAKYAGTVLLSVGLSAGILVPTLSFLLSHSAQDNVEFNEMKATILDVLNSLFMGVMPTLDNKVPFLYCGIIIIPLLFVFYKSREIDKKVKLAFNIVLGFLLICMLVKPAYVFMHAFDYPNFYGYRFSFLAIYTLVFMGSIAISHIKEIDFKVFKIIALVTLVFYSVMMAYQKISFANVKTNTSEELAINGIFIAIWLIFLFIYKNDKARKGLIVGFIAIVCIELTANAYMCINKNMASSMPDAVINESFYAEKSAIEQIHEVDNGFYRVFVNNLWNVNSEKIFGYNGTNTFSSTDNYQLRLALSRLGFSSSNRNLMNHCNIPVMSQLLGVKYYVDVPRFDVEMGGVINKDYYVPADVYLDEDALSLGFMVNEGVLDYHIGENSFDNIEGLVNAMAGTDEDIFEDISIQDENFTLVNVGYDRVGDKYSFYRHSDDFENCNMSIDVENPGNVYVEFFEAEPESETAGTSVVVDEIGALSYTHPSLGGVYKMNHSEDGNNKLEMSIDSDFSVDAIHFASFNPDACKVAIDRLKENQLQLVSFANDNIQGVVNVTEENNVLFTSIPYDKCWYVYVDGMPVTRYAVAGNAFLAAKLTPGTHTVQFIYVEENSSIGAIVTMLSVLIYVFLVLMYLLKVVKKDKVQVATDDNKENIQSEDKKE